MPATATHDVVYIHPDDNVCIAIRDLDGSSQISAGPWDVTLTGKVGLGHKIALVEIAKGQRVIRYGQTIGFATETIEPGDWVHTHNLTAGEFTRDYQYATEIPPPPTPIEGRTFQGYRRTDGKVGTRNYLAVISTVNCSASVSKYIAQRFDRGLLAQFPNVDGILPLVHKSGCGLQYGGEDHQQFNRVLAGFARHANVGGFLLVGLGCETATMPYLVEQGGLVQIGAPQRKLPPMLSMQVAAAQRRPSRPRYGKSPPCCPR